MNAALTNADKGFDMELTKKLLSTILFLSVPVSFADESLIGQVLGNVKQQTPNAPGDFKSKVGEEISNKLTLKQCDKYGISSELLVADFIYRGGCVNSGFPYRLMGKTIIKGNDVPEPPNAAKLPICKCKKYRWGITKGMWLPTRIVEVVRGDGSCSPTQGKLTNLKLGIMTKVLQTTGLFSRGGENFKHYHSWKIKTNFYPGISPSERCWKRGNEWETSMMDIVWSANDPIFANLYYPENFLIAPMSAMTLGVDRFASCSINTLKSPNSLQRFDDSLYYLGGCYDDNFPVNGHFPKGRNSVEAGQLIAQRSVFASNRKSSMLSLTAYTSLTNFTTALTEGRTGYAAYNSVGDVNVCGATKTLIPKKSHYKFSMLRPYSEAKHGKTNKGSGGILKSLVIDSAIAKIKKQDPTQPVRDVISDLTNQTIGNLMGKVKKWTGFTTSCSHRWGASATRWGDGRNSAGNPNTVKQSDGTVLPKETKDKDSVYIIWRWVDCCSRL
ncbi:MAG: TraU family protein [Neisseriaceae bacterium]|nr:TraU family protein [Neisseriaceae bacterium]